jgi:hypothetical protein
MEATDRNSINWTVIRQQPKKDQFVEVSRAVAREDWTITDLVLGPSGIREQFLAAALGMFDPAAKERDQNAAVDRRFKLRVLPGATVFRDNERIEGADAKPGDVIRWHLGPVARNADGSPCDARDISELARRGLPTVLSKHYRIGSDGCIDVGVEHAYQMITRYGQFVSMPEFSRKPIKGTDKTPARRGLSNWWFTEVRPGDENKRTRRGRATEQDATPESAE